MMNSSLNFLPEAMWLWPNTRMYLQNCYAGFRYDFDLVTLPSSAPLCITADQSYRLHVNGKYVCRGPRRGYQDHWPFDTPDILPYLKTGHNWISVEAYNPGISTFFYNHRDSAGFLCSADWDNGVKFWTEPEHWKSFRNTAYTLNTARLSVQIGFQEVFDQHYDDRKWITEPTCSEFPPQPLWVRTESSALGALPWSAMEDRRIPMLDESLHVPDSVCRTGKGNCSPHTAPVPGDVPNIAWGFAEKELSSIVYDEETPVFSRDGDSVCCQVPAAGKGNFRIVIFDLGAETWLPGTPILSWENADDGMVMDLFYSHWLPEGKLEFLPEPGKCSLLSMAGRVIVSQQNGSFEAYQIMGVRHVSLVIRENTAPVTVKLSWRSTVYPMEIRGDFHCSDPILNKIYSVCVHTQKVCSMDAFVDTPWREQSQWWGDARVQSRNFHFLTGDVRMLTQGIRSIAGQPEPHGLTFAHSPTSDNGCILPDFALTWLITLRDLWFQTGSAEMLHEQKRKADSILAYFEGTRNEQGLLQYDPRFWLFEDHGDMVRRNTPTFLNLWHYYALMLYSQLLEAAGYLEDLNTIRKRMESEKSAIEQYLFDREQQLFAPEMDEHQQKTGIPNVHDQVLALLCGICPAAQDPMLKKRILPCLNGTLLEGMQPGSFWATYLLDCAQQFGLRQEALSYIRRKWEKMIPTGTTWEVFERGDYPGWSYSHAWSAHPVTHLPEIIFGLKQTAPAWKNVILEPSPLMETASFRIPVPQGMLSVCIRKQDGESLFSCSIPQGMCAEIRLPDETIHTKGEACEISRKMELDHSRIPRH